MTVYMIHELNRKKLLFLDEIVREEDILTFDDGLYSHYRYWGGIRDMFPKNRKIFFIPTEAVRAGAPTDSYVKCEEAMHRWSLGDHSAYMSWEEISALHEDGAEIGGHGHGHFYSYGDSREEELFNFKKDIEEMNKQFKINLGFKPKTFARPYNKEQLLEKTILGDLEIFGGERTDIRELMGDPGYDASYRCFKKYKKRDHRIII